MGEGGLGLLGRWVCVPRKRPGKLLKVMSFNLRYKNHDDDVHGFGWEQRLPAVTEVVIRRLLVSLLAV